MLLKKEKYKINSVNTLYLLIHKLDDFIEEKRGNKYLNIAFADNNDELKIITILRLIHFYFLLSFRSSLQEHFQNYIFFSFLFNVTY